jgi:hypothetical protein
VKGRHDHELKPKGTERKKTQNSGQEAVLQCGVPSSRSDEHTVGDGHVEALRASAKEYSRSRLHYHRKITLRPPEVPPRTPLSEADAATCSHTSNSLAREEDEDRPSVGVLDPVRKPRQPKFICHSLERQEDEPVVIGPNYRSLVVVPVLEP